MIDAYGRKIDYLRVSLTDKCNLRCRYCMPEEGIKHLSHDDILSFEEIRRIVDIMTGLGIEKVRLTGGEPLIRRGITYLVGMLSCDVYMTTNGCMLKEKVHALKEAGLCGVNISLDTLDKDTFRKLTGRDGLESVIEGIDAAISAELNVKLNCVPVRGINDHEIEKLCGFAQDRGVDIRFIELMPIGCAKDLKGIPSKEIIGMLESTAGTAKVTADETGPARYYIFGENTGRVGFISPMSRKFCGSCNRVRLTAEGFLKLCLQYPDGIDLKKILRSGAGDEEIKGAIEEAVGKKPHAHCFEDADVSDNRKMVQIGG